ncbi:MAG: cell division protein FtsA [Candidatus Gottesmanbacteria bacterium]|nr:cell division protein FtsA [Candidatus Gottesmanbacteria bacterium]
MARDRTISSIDIGSSKITTLIASIGEEDTVNVLGVSTVSSRGLRKGQVVNIEDATASISKSLEAAERMAGTTVGMAYVSIGGNHITSLNSHGVVAVSEPDKEITPQDVVRVIDAAKAVQLPSSREVLHVLPRGYIVDGQEGIVDPVGMTGVRLEVDTHLVTGGATAVRNHHKCVEELGVDIGDIVFGGLASSYASLTDTEKELGVVLVDVGGGTTDVAIFIEGALSYSSVIPVGAINITKDIAAGLRVSLESAEKIKIALSLVPKTSVMPDEGMEMSMKKKPGEPVSDDIDLSHLGLPEEMRSVSKKTLIDGIVRPRLNEIFTMVGLEIKRSGFGGMTPSGIVLTGGGALTVGAVEAARRNLAMPVHTAIPGKISGLIDEIMSPAYATSIGLLLYGAKSGKNETGRGFGGFARLGGKFQVKGIAGKVIDLVKSFLP